MTATAKSWTINKAPKQLSLLGDKTVKAESAEHIIEFPGGAIEVSRTSDNEYWAHIIVNHRGFCASDGDGLQSARGEVVETRIDSQHWSHGVSAEGSLEQVLAGGRTAWEWLRKLADRLERVRLVHGAWDRCLAILAYHARFHAIEQRRAGNEREAVAFETAAKWLGGLR